MVDAITGLDEKLTDIRVRLGRLEERSVHTEGRADRTNTEMGEVKAMTTEKRKDFDRELAALKAMTSCMQ